MPIDYYYHWLSPPCRTVSLVIKHLNLDVNYIVVDMSKGEHKKDGLLKINPAGQLPTINDNGYALGESRAIVSYLCNEYAPDSDLYPKDPQKRAQVDRILYFDAGTFFPVFKRYLFTKGVLDMEPPKEFKAEMQEKLKLLNTFIGDKKYVAGDHLTIADFSLFSSASYFDWVQMDLNEAPNVSNWIKRIKDEHQYANEVSTQFDGMDELKVALNQNPLVIGLAKTVNSMK